MKKTKLAIGIMTAMLTAGTLAGCDNTVKYSADGKIITYNDGNKTITITADVDAEDGSSKSLLAEYYKDSSKFQSIFDAINSIVIRNYFKTTEPGTTDRGEPQMKQINADAKKKVDADKDQANRNASNNGTSYTDEFNAILSSKGAKDEEELEKKYVEELQRETFEDNFYKYHIDELKSGDETVKYDKLPDGTGGKQLWNGYFKDMVPYHVSHILVKVEDGSGTNYANGTISEDNAKKLFNVVDALAKGEDSFGTIAHRFSEDTGSAANYGDLGIMDYSTGYVNEFKLGIYAYENFLNAKDGVKNEVLASNIKITGNKENFFEIEGIAKSFIDESKGAFDNEIVPTIDYKIFKELNEVADKEKDDNGKSVIEDSANFYPRNIIYNKYLNRHSIAYIVNDTESDEIANHSTGFVNTQLPDGSTKPVLSVKTASGWTPILCVRAGSDYQGIHFIVVNRSKFTATDNNGVSLSDYYTTYYPEQDKYPKYPKDVDPKENPKPTYVNFSSSVTAETKSRAESLLSTMKSYDSERLNRYIFQKFFDLEGLNIVDPNLKELLNMWISRGLDKKEQEKQDAWDKTWADYVDTLRKQNSERTKLVSQACRIAYLNGNGLDKNKQKVELSDIIDQMAQAMVDAKEVATLEEAKTEILSIRIGNAKLSKENLVAATGVYKANVKYYKANGDELVAGTDYNVGDPIGPEVYVLKSIYISEISDLFKKEGALCNDGKDHI